MCICAFSFLNVKPAPCTAVTHHGHLETGFKKELLSLESQVEANDAILWGECEVPS
jgi:hypothetical protein